MGLLRSIYNGREMSRATRVLGTLLPGELLVATQTSNMASPWGPYIEGYFVLTTQRLGFRTTTGPDLAVQTNLLDINAIDPAPSPVSHHVGVQVQLAAGDRLTASTSNDFVGVLFYTVALAKAGAPLHDPDTLVRDAITLWYSRLAQ